MATIQAEFVLGELSKDELSTANVYDSALPWLTVPERCAFMVMVMMASGQAEFVLRELSKDELSTGNFIATDATAFYYFCSF